MDIDWHGPQFVIAIVAMSMGAWILTTWIRARHGYPVEGEWGGTVAKSDPQADRKLDALTAENAQLRGELQSIKQRLANVERIVTDDANTLVRDIDALRTPVN